MTREFDKYTGHEIDLLWNGHTHTEFCKHGDGAGAPLENYLEQAIASGFKKYSVTEHPPLPKGWLNDPVKMCQLAMPEDQLENYFLRVQKLKRYYHDRLTILSGLELDYLYGKESFTNNMIDSYSHWLDDAIVSVHFLPGRDGMYCIDWSPEDLQSNLLNYYGTMDNLVEHYYEHIEMAIQFAATLPFNHVRIGHMTLIDKFRRVLPEYDAEKCQVYLKRMLVLLKETGVGVDVNSAGLRVHTCGDFYIPEWFFHQCIQNGIEGVFGSDAHKPADVKSGWSWYKSAIDNYNKK